MTEKKKKEMKGREGKSCQLDVLTNSHPVGRSPTTVFRLMLKRNCLREKELDDEDGGRQTGPASFHPPFV